MYVLCGIARKPPTRGSNPMNQTIDRAKSPLDISERWGAWMRALTLCHKPCHDCGCAHRMRPCQRRRQRRQGRISAGAGQRAGSQDDDGADPLRVRGPDRGLEGSRSSRARAGHSGEASVPGRQPRQRRPDVVRARLAPVRGAGAGSRSRAGARSGAVLAGQAQLRSRQTTDRQQRVESARIR